MFFKGLEDKKEKVLNFVNIKAIIVNIFITKSFFLVIDMNG